MSLTEQFSPSALPGEQGSASRRRKRPAPFSLRLTAEERARLMADAGGLPLAAYIKGRLFGAAPPARARRTGLIIQDREAHAQALALLGRSHLANNLNQLAHAVNIGVLPITPETEAELREAVQAVKAIRTLLLTALGFQTEAAL